MPRLSANGSRRKRESLIGYRRNRYGNTRVAGATTFFNTGDSLPDDYQQLVQGQLEGFTQFFPSEKSVTAGLTSRIDQLNRGDTAAGTLPRYYKKVDRASLLVVVRNERIGFRVAALSYDDGATWPG